MAAAMDNPVDNFAEKPAKFLFNQAIFSGGREVLQSHSDFSAHAVSQRVQRSM
jgi:hypothetical protein